MLHPLIDAGELPVLRRIVEAGPSGQLLSVQPLVSIAQWTTVITGKRPWQHRVCHPLEKIGAGGEPFATTAASRRALALWEILAKAGKRSIVVGFPATHGGQCANGIIVSDQYARPTAGPGVNPWPPAAQGTYSPLELGKQLDRWRMSPEEVQADIISLCIPGWKQIDQKRDRRLGKLRLFLATDFSHQAAAMTLLTANEWDFAAVHFPALGAITQTFLSHHFRPTARAGELEFKIYQDVIRGVCRLLDQMLGNLLRAAGENARIILVSDHGVATQTESLSALPPGDEAAWKSPMGSLLPAVRDSPPIRCYLAPRSWISRPRSWPHLDCPSVTTWKAVCWSSALKTRLRFHMCRAGNQPAILIRLQPRDNRSCPRIPLRRPGSSARRDRNLAQSFLEAGRPEEAFPMLNKLFLSFPERTELALALFQCQLALKKIQEAADTLEILLEGLSGKIWPLLLQAELSLAQGRSDVARALACEARELKPQSPDALRSLGMLWLRLRDWTALELLARQALKLDRE